MAKAGKSQLNKGISRVVNYIAEMTEMSVVDALEKDHRDLKDFIKVLKGDETYRTKKAAFGPFVELLKSHAKSEEKAVYDVCLKYPELREEAFEGYVEHGVADHLAKAAGRLRDRDHWMAQVKVLAELVEHHIEEEENELFPDLRKRIDAERRQAMAEKFIALRERSQPHHRADNAGVLA